MRSSPRCGAKTRKGKPCQSPAMPQSRINRSPLPVVVKRTRHFGVRNFAKWHKTDMAGLFGDF
jgi:hypothetical protein